MSKATGIRGHGYPTHADDETVVVNGAPKEFSGSYNILRADPLTPTEQLSKVRDGGQHDMDGY
jgi:hypothetical protein